MGDTSKRYHWTDEDKKRMADLYGQEWSFEEIAEEMGCTRETVRYHLIRLGTPLRPRGMSTPRARAKVTGPRHGMWKGGRQRTSAGYIRAYAPDNPRVASDGTVAEHRLVVETHLRENDPSHPALAEDGYLRRNWVVHHRNGIKDDNRLENLEAMIPSGPGGHHSWMHYHDEMARLRKLLTDNGIES